MAAAARLLALVFVAALALTSTAAAQQQQQVPGLLQCAQAAQNVDEDAILIRLAPCAAGTNAECCKSAQALLGLGGGGELAGCLCSHQIFVDQLLDRVASNQLAKQFGVTRESTLNIFKSCKISYVGGEGDSACPSSKHGDWSMGMGKHGADGESKHGRRLFDVAA